MSDIEEHDLKAGDELLANATGGPAGLLPDDMHPLARKIIWILDWFSEWQGRVVALLVVPIIFAMVYEVLARKFFVAPTLWAFDVSRMLYGVSFMLGAAYVLMKGLHIRADFIYQSFTVKTQGRVDLLLYIVLFVPSMLFLLSASYEFALKSFLQNEHAGDSTWAPVIWPIKTALSLGVFFLVVQGVSEILKSWYAATRGKWPR